ncbi:FecR family protein [Zunongwangia atlantica]|uniref:FecR protein n=1 Tax=Zunongwangia atlantica 22II14-10F7 TaxID=1185767 RepID=A0A1Y1T8I0_9FLAO|nr:FecR domain-containing protein [Zunongwangia atlantica]ORL47370.1 fecR protein [Zunongwangia atlantica 22II14-10F7]
MKKINKKELKCIRYLAGEMSLEDRSVFEIELSLDETLREIFDNYKSVWEQYDTEKSIPISFQEKTLSHKNVMLASATAVVGIVLFFCFSWFSVTPKWNHIIAENGQRKTLFLSDSSKVILNAGSSLSFPEEFTDYREVKLTGEAYFEISKDAAHPFIVNSTDFKVKVLGTQFSVNNAYAKKEVALKEGAVEFIQNNNNDKITLSPGERLIWDTANNQVHKESFNPKVELAWTTNTLLLDNILFRNALKDINQFYGVSFVIKNSGLLDQHITGIFKDENLNDFIHSLEFIADVEIEELQDKIFLIKSKQND